MTTPFPLPELDDTPPSGPNLELDAQFGEMERAAQGKAESQFGNTVEAAQPPDWKETARLAEELLARTRDLRVLAPLAIARLHLDGIPGFAAVLATIRAQVTSAWESVHPQLDPEDDNDPMQRANALLLLQDPARVLRPMRDLPLATTPRTGPVSWRDIAIVSGTIEAEPGREKLSESAIRAAFAGADPGRTAALREAVASVLDDLKAIPAAFDTYSTYGSGPDFKDLGKLVRDIQAELTRYEQLAEPEPDEAEPSPPDDDAEAAAPRAAPRGGRSFASIQAIAALTNRDDALHALELAASYFRSHEPSSPLPLLIDRAKRLAPLPFLEILRDMAPDGLQQAQLIAGAGDRRDDD